MPRGLAPATTVVQRAAASGTIISSQISRNEKVRVVLLSPGSHEKSTNRHEGFTGGCGNGVLVCDMHTWIGTNRVSQRIAASISVALTHSYTFFHVRDTVVQSLTWGSNCLTEC